MASESESGIPKIIKDFGVTIHELLRYALSGVGCFVIYYFSLTEKHEKEWFSSLCLATPQAVAVLVILGVGVLAYVISRQSMMRFEVRLARLSTIWRRTIVLVLSLALLVISGLSNPWAGCAYGLPTLILVIILVFTEDVGLTRQQVLDHKELDCNDVTDPELKFAMILAKNNGKKRLWHESEQEKLFRQHSENHLVLVLSLACFAAWLRLSFTSRWEPAISFLNAGTFMWIVAFSADLHLFKREGALLNSAGNPRLKEQLEKCWEAEDKEAQPPMSANVGAG